MIDTFLKEKAVFNDNFRKTWMKKQQEIILQTDPLSLKINPKNDLSPEQNKEIKTSQAGRKLSFQSKVLEKKIEINIVNPTQKDFSSPKTIQALSITSPKLRSNSIITSPRTLGAIPVEIPFVRSNSKASPNSPRTMATLSVESPLLQPKLNMKDSIYLFDLDSKTNSPRKLKHPSCSITLPQLSTCASTIFFPDAESPVMAKHTSNIKDNSTTNQSPRIRVVIEKSPIKSIKEEEPFNPKNFMKKLQLSPLKSPRETEESLSYGYVDIFQTRNHQKSPLKTNETLKTDRIPTLEDDSLFTMMRTPTGKELISGKKLMLMKTIEKARFRSYSILTGNTGKTSNKGSISARKLDLNFESIQRTEHDFVESNQLLSTRMAGSKLSKTKHNMFRSFKHN